MICQSKFINTDEGMNNFINLLVIILDRSLEVGKKSVVVQSFTQKEINLKDIFISFLENFPLRKMKIPSSYFRIKLKVSEILKNFLEGHYPVLKPNQMIALNTLLYSIENHFQSVERKDLLNEFVSFVKTCEDKKAKKETLIDQRVYFACPVGNNINKLIPPLTEGNYSNHITVAFSSSEKQDYIRFLGQKCSIQIGKEIVFWKDTNGEKYGYLPVKVIFSDDTEKITHISVHNLNGGGKSYGKNHSHQKKNQKENQNEISFISDETCFSYLLTRPHGSDSETPWLTSDLDGTLLTGVCMKEHGTFSNEKLKYTGVILLKNLTQFAQDLIVMNIPFVILTSRREYPHHQYIPNSELGTSNLVDALKKIFQSLVQVLFGKKIYGSGRALLKAEGKVSKMIKGVLHVDDEEIVYQTRGYGVHIINEQILEFKTSEPTTTIKKPKIVGVFGSPGSGKSTLIKRYIEETGCIHLLDVGSESDEPSKPIIILCSADGSEPSHLCLSSYGNAVQTKYPDRDVIVIYDTTGKGRKDFKFPIFHIESNDESIVGCMKALLNRSGHANLNGKNEFDFSAQQIPWKFDTNEMDLNEFVNYLWILSGEDKGFFKEQMKLMGQSARFVDVGELKTLITSYCEGSQKWHAIWGRQNRNCVFHLNNNKWEILKIGLNNGSELKPKEQNELGDCYHKPLSQVQTEIRKILYSEGVIPTKTVLTSKVDGSLIQFVFIPLEDDKSIYTNYLSGNENEFAKAYAKASYKKYDGKAFTIIATNGTLQVSEHMISYVVTAFSQEFKYVNPNRNNLEVWNDLIPKILNREYAFLYDNVKNNFRFTGNITLQFEAICENRMTRDGEVHTELAMSYPFGGLFFLGLTYISSRRAVYVPHFDVEKLVNQAGYKQPLFWKNRNGKKIIQMLYDLEKVSTGSCTMENFLTKYKPDNAVMPNKWEIDHEGFVILVKTKLLRGWEYNKLKTEPYYLFHKLHLDRMEKVIEYAITLDLPQFPIASTIKKWIENMELIDKEKIKSIFSHIFSDNEPQLFSNERHKDAFYRAKKTSDEKAYWNMIRQTNSNILFIFRKMILSSFKLEHLFREQSKIDSMNANKVNPKQNQINNQFSDMEKKLDELPFTQKFDEVFDELGKTLLFMSINFPEIPTE